ncbi:MAG: c-type cytochrome [Hyphomicrobiales bacterium]|nr:c-type cytochrome [Hyphomicrobiales bacterium]
MRGAVLACGLALAAATAEANDQAAGERLAQTACAACHNVGRAGDSPAPDARPFRDIMSILSGEEIEADLRAGLPIAHKRRIVAPYPVSEASNLYAYMRALAAEIAD